MSVFRSFPFISHYLGDAHTHVVHLNKGVRVHEGIGQSFWFRPQTSVLSEVPATDQEQPAVFHVHTRDQQDIMVQANVTYRFADPFLASQHLNFGVFPRAKQNEAEANGRERVAQVIALSVQSISLSVIAGLDLNQTLETGVTMLQNALMQGLGADSRLASNGVQILGVRVLSVRPESDVEKALQTPVRERLHTEADRSTYERRALAVERERTISENELASKIELAKRHELLLAQEGVNAQRKAKEDAASALIAAQSRATREELRAKSESEQKTILAQAEAASIREIGAAKASETEALMQAYAQVGKDVITALAMREAASNLPAVGNLTITPDVLTGLLGNLLGGGPTEGAGTDNAGGRNA